METEREQYSLLSSPRKAKTAKKRSHATVESAAVAHLGRLEGFLPETGGRKAARGWV